MAYFSKSSKEKRKRQLRSAVARTGKALKKGAKATQKEVSRAFKDGVEARKIAKDPNVKNDEEEIKLLRKIIANQKDLERQISRLEGGSGGGTDPEFGFASSETPGESGDDFDWTGWL